LRKYVNVPNKESLISFILLIITTIKKNFQKTVPTRRDTYPRKFSTSSLADLDMYNKQGSQQTQLRDNIQSHHLLI